MTQNLPRLMIAAGASGSGKTMVTLGILQMLKKRGLKVLSCKCGPDYIDPMFHKKVLQTPSVNLDTFFTGYDMTRYLLADHGRDADIAVMEGVMGYYDGVAGTSTEAGAYDLARTTDTPVVFLVNAKGMSLSVIPYIKGFLEYRQDSRIALVLLNRVSPMLYGRLKEQIEAELPVKVAGYIPEQKELTFDSRHLGLVMPEEVADLQKKIECFAEDLEKTIDVDVLLAAAQKAAPLVCKEPKLNRNQYPVTLAVAKDEAFCFVYEDNLRLLEKMGAKLEYFSPLHDKKLPEGIQGLLLYGGYPELYAGQLSAKKEMKESIRTAIENGLPALAECGGFLYLHDTMEDMEGHAWPMAGVIKGQAFKTGSLKRFGYITLEPRITELYGQSPESIRAHEFHYFDSTANGEAFLARKPRSSKNWNCIQVRGNLVAGFPHIYYYANPAFAENFLRACMDR